MPTSDDLIPAAEVSRLTGADRATVSRWAASGKLPTALRSPGLRGSRFFYRSDVDALIAARLAELQAQVKRLRVAS